jgi:hypothetical protein
MNHQITAVQQRIAWHSLPPEQVLTAQVSGAQVIKSLPLLLNANQRLWT